MKSIFDHGPEYAKNKALNKKVNAGTGRMLTKLEQRFKTKDWPKSKRPMTREEKIKMLGE